jgi:hypothetical protein
VESEDVEDRNESDGGTSTINGTSDIQELTDVISAIKHIDEVPDSAKMADDPRLQQAFDLIRAVIADADKRAAARMMQRLTTEVGDLGQEAGPLFKPATTSVRPDKRAPHGSSERLIDRALTEAGPQGLTVLGIEAKAQTDYEKMVSASAIRNWLRENERRNPPKYRQIGGVWYLAQFVPTIKAVS